MEIMQRDQIPRKRFSGVREHRLVMDPGLFGEQVGERSWSGSGNLVYLADARLVPAGETGMHDHHEIDVITLLIEGRLSHQGSLQSGSTLESGDVQVQRAGSEGFSHNEINPDNQENRLIQLWVKPETNSGAAGCYNLKPVVGGVTRIYGGDSAAAPIAQNSTLIDVATLKAEQSIDINVPFLAYVCRGKGFANEEMVSEGDLLRADQLSFDATADVQLIIVHQVP